MKRTSLWLILAIATAVQATTPDASTLQPPELKPLAQQPRAAHLAAEVLNRFHYQPVPLDHTLAEKVFDRYVKILDPERLFFIQSDIDRWKDARSHLDEAILKEDLATPFDLFNLYSRRAVERFTYARELLKTGFDFQVQESYQARRDKAPWPQSDTDARELWRKRVKGDWLRLKLTGKDDKSIAETLDKRYENFIKRMAKAKSEDAFQAFMNAYTMSVDPHTNYLGPQASEDFDISMKLSLVGIGAALEEKDEYTVIRELIPGSPALLSGKLKAGDRIVGVAQGDGPMVDVLGWRLDDTVALIRGTADTTVVLDILPAEVGPDGKHNRVTLIRKKVSLEEQAAKKSIQTITEGGVTHRIGIISLPGFYEDFAAHARGDANYRSASRDVARLLRELKAEKVDSVLIDLRDNGGGSLTEAIELTGLFIDVGPVVMQKDARGRIDVGRDTRPGAEWTGPLGVLINRGSASASEIFAAAIQDYSRGLIIGEPSFGKGTVQTIVDMDQLTRNDTTEKSKKLGEIKLTIAQFFRINGGTTQLRGVTPDIPLPGFSDPELFGESSYENALPWVQISKVEYQPQADFTDLLPTLLARHDKRLTTDPEFRYLNEDLEQLASERKKTEVSLNETDRRRAQEAQEARQKAREPAKSAGTENGAKSPAKLATTAEKASATEEDDQDDGEGKTKKNAKDLLLQEAVHILGDEVTLLKIHPGQGNRALTAGTMPKQ